MDDLMDTDDITDTTFAVPLWSPVPEHSQDQELYDLLTDSQRQLFTQDESFEEFFNIEDVNQEFQVFFNVTENDLLNEAIIQENNDTNTDINMDESTDTKETMRNEENNEIDKINVADNVHNSTEETEETMTNDVNQEFQGFFNVTENNLLNEAMIQENNDTHTEISINMDETTDTTGQREETMTNEIDNEIDEINVVNYVRNTTDNHQVTQTTSSNSICKYCSQSYAYQKSHLRGNSKCLEQFMKEHNLNPQNWEEGHRRHREGLQASRQQAARREETQGWESSSICKYCSQFYVYQKSHLRGNSKCLEQFMEEYKLNPQNWEEGHRRHRVGLQASRQQAARREETQRCESRLYSPENFLQTVNNKMISNGNKFICFVCNQMILHSNTTFVDVSNSNEERHKYSSGCAVCKSCVKGVPIERHIQHEEAVFFKTIVHNEIRINIPQTDGSTTEEVDGGQPIILPINGSVLNRYQDIDKFKVNKFMKENVTICPGEIQLKSLPSAAYNYQFCKIRDAFQNSEVYLGNILSEETNSIKIQRNIPMLDKVKGTQEYELKYVEELRNQFFYCGQLCLKVDLELNVPSKASFLYMLQHRNENKIEISEEQWKVHSNHNSSKSCNERCIKLDLEHVYKNYVKEHLISGVHLHTEASYLNDYFQVLSNSLKKMFGSSNFSSFLHFANGKIILRGIFWPESFQDLNLHLSNNKDLTSEEKAKIIEFVEKFVCATTEWEYLQEKFDLSEIKAKEISKSVKKVQTGDQFFFPSNMTMITDTNNSEYSTIFRDLRNQFRLLIESMESETKHLNELFAKIEENEDFEIQEDEHYVRLKLPNQNCINIPRVSKYDLFKDLGLSSLNSIYHTAIAQEQSNHGIQLVLKRQLCDSKIDSYCPLMMLDAHQEISLLGANHQSIFNQLMMNEQDIPDEFSEDHGLFSGIQTIFLLDANKSFICRGNSSISVNLSQNRARAFKKAENPDEMTYTDISSGKKYVLLEDIYSKYLTRQDNPFLCFAEFISVYDVKSRGEKESSDSEGHELSDKHLSTCCENQSLLPKEITTSSGSKLRMRRNRRPIMIKHISKEGLFSDEQMYYEVKLYIPHTNENFIIENFMNLYSMRCCQKFDGNIPLTKLQVIQKKVFPNYDRYFGDKFFNV